MKVTPEFVEATVAALFEELRDHRGGWRTAPLIEDITNQLLAAADLAGWKGGTPQLAEAALRDPATLKWLGRLFGALCLRDGFRLVEGEIPNSGRDLAAAAMVAARPGAT